MNNRRDLNLGDRGCIYQSSFKSHLDLIQFELTVTISIFDDVTLQTNHTAFFLFCICIV